MDLQDQEAEVELADHAGETAVHLSMLFYHPNGQSTEGKSELKFRIDRALGRKMLPMLTMLKINNAEA